MSIDKDRCWSCGLCVGICPEGAIVLVDKGTGKTVWNGKGLAVPFSNVLHRRI
jgi:Fe-S-cluster-containing hydrogenase component 2